MKNVKKGAYSDFFTKVSLKEMFEIKSDDVSADDVSAVSPKDEAAIDFMLDGSENAITVKETLSFESICERVKKRMTEEWERFDDFEKQENLEREKAAILGHKTEMDFYKARIREIIAAEGLQAETPPWYEDLTGGIFAELYGLAGLSPWVYDKTEAYKNSSSAKLIGDRLYCLIDGKSQLQPQRIAGERREQLKRAFLMSSPRERQEKGFHELYLSNGIRVTIYSGERTKPDQEIMVFRKYLLRELSFESLAELETIPKDAIRLFETMVKLGFNVLFAGTVRSGKTTFLQTWQSYESSELEGLAISTDPETPWERIMPNVPIMQLVADGKDLENITKSLLRGDNDYVILEEMRDAQSYRLSLELASIGEGRCKATVHTGDVVNLPYKIASKIREVYGGDEQSLISQVFRSFDYVFEFCQMQGNRAEKKLRSISELCYDAERDEVSIHEVCVYDEKRKDWLWSGSIGKDKENRLMNMYEEGKTMKRELETLWERNPMVKENIIYPRYYHPSNKERVNGYD